MLASCAFSAGTLVCTKPTLTLEMSPSLHPMPRSMQAQVIDSRSATSMLRLFVQSVVEFKKGSRALLRGKCARFTGPSSPSCSTSCSGRERQRRPPPTRPLGCLPQEKRARNRWMPMRFPFRRALGTREGGAVLESSRSNARHTKALLGGNHRLRHEPAELGRHTSVAALH